MKLQEKFILQNRDLPVCRDREKSGFKGNIIELKTIKVNTFEEYSYIYDFLKSEGYEFYSAEDEIIYFPLTLFIVLSKDDKYYYPYLYFSSKVVGRSDYDAKTIIRDLKLKTI